MCVCLCVCVYVCVFMYVCVSVFVCVFVYTCVSVWSIMWASSTQEVYRCRISPLSSVALSQRDWHPYAIKSLITFQDLALMSKVPNPVLGRIPSCFLENFCQDFYKHQATLYYLHLYPANQKQFRRCSQKCVLSTHYMWGRKLSSIMSLVIKCEGMR